MLSSLIWCSTVLSTGEFVDIFSNIFWRTSAKISGQNVFSKNRNNYMIILTILIKSINKFLLNLRVFLLCVLLNCLQGSTHWRVVSPYGFTAVRGVPNLESAVTGTCIQNYLWKVPLRSLKCRSIALRASSGRSDTIGPYLFLFY